MNTIVIWLMIAHSSSGQFVYQSPLLPTKDSCTKFEATFNENFNSRYKTFDSIKTVCIQTLVVK